jgi:hypothetical protein
MKFYLGIYTIIAKNCNKPTFNNYSGRTWDTGLVKINGVETKVHLDTSRSNHFYFQYEEKWLRIQMSSTASDKFDYDIDPMDKVNPCELTTTSLA